MRVIAIILIICTLIACQEKQTTAPPNPHFYAIQDDEGIKVFNDGKPSSPIITQVARQGHRPYLHPITAPNSDISLTQYSPDHHKHQTGLYWGFTRVNGSGASPEILKEWFYNRDKPTDIQQQIGRDFFHHPGEDYWQKISSDIIIDEGPELKWQTIYNMLDEAGAPIMEESQTWTFHEKDDKYLLSLEWRGKALTDITINEFDYGGLFLRMPWSKDVKGEAVNAARQTNQLAEGKRAMWVDVGMEIEGLKEDGHIAIFDHPDNDGFPQTWRVDGQLGVGPVRARMGDWHIDKGETATYQHQIVAYSGDHSDIDMNDLWGSYVADDGMYNTASLWGIAQQEGRDAKFLTADEAVQQMTIKDGYTVNAYASEPMITQPMAFCWDDKGRMWIAENRDYESRGYGFSNSGDSRILILEDTDRDGVADKRTVFLEGIPFPSAIAVGFDGLFLGAPPNLLFVPDRDHDDAADIEDIEVLLTGWGIRDRHETINSFQWGPDGWLYGLEGFATPSKIRKPVDKGKIYKKGETFPDDLLESDGIDINGGVWRYHPTKKKFEAIAHGFSNPWGIDYDAKGQMFISACVIPHLFHVIPGGIYHRQGGRHFNPYVYKDIQTIVDHRHRSAHGGARVYQSDAFSEDQKGRIFMANIHEHAVLSDVLTSNGSGFVASHGEDFMLANNAQWIGFSMEVGPEGGLYVLDWHDADICGKEVLHKETGRVFRIMPENSYADEWQGRYVDLNSLSDVQLVELQLKNSNWHARRARTILQKRATQRNLESTAVERAMDIFENEPNADYQLRAMWTMHVTSTLTPEILKKSLHHKDPHIRAWAVQMACEDQDPAADVIDRMTTMASSDQSPVVRLYLASALQRIEDIDKWRIAEELVRWEEDSDDPNIPLMLWYGIENLVSTDETRALRLATKSKIPLIVNHIARRLVDADKVEILIANLERSHANRSELLSGMLAGLEGRVDIREPSNWAKTYDQLKSNSKLSSIATMVHQNFGSTAAAKEMLATLTNKDADMVDRSQAIITLSGQRREELVEHIPALLKIDELRLEAIRAIASYEVRDLGQILLDKYNDFTLIEKQEAIQTLASRPIYGSMLAGSIKDEVMPRRDIPAYIALQLRRVVGNGFVEIWGPIDEMSSDRKSQYAKYQRLLSDQAIASSNPHEGRKVFQRVCGICHKMYGEGGILGPDLTGSNRGNVPYLLSNIIEPSGEIQDDYRMVVITTQDGRTYSGNIVSETDRQVTMRVVGQDDIIINSSDIQTKEITPKSMMPEGIFNTMTDQEVLNLTAYMRTLDQVAISDG